MVFTYTQSINPGYESNQSAVDAVNSDIDNNIATVRNSTTVTPGQFQIEFASQPTPEEFSLIAGYIAVHDPYRSPVQLTPYTYDGSGVMRTDFMFPGQNESTTISFLGERDNEIHISKDTQCKYNTIRAAFDAETAENLVFIVHPGTYNETNPLVLRNGCVLKSEGIFENTTIVAGNPNSNLINLGNKCLLKGLTLQGATGACGVYFDASASGGAGYVSSVQECAIKNCNVAVESDGKNGAGIPDTLFCEKLKIAPLSQNLSKGLYAHAKGQLVSSVLNIAGIPGSFTVLEGVKAEDSGTKISVSLNSLWFLTKAMVVDNGGELEVNLVTAANNNIGLEIGATGTTSILNAAGLGIKNSITYDVNVLPSDAVLQIHSGVLNDTKINNPNKLTLNAVYHLVRYGKYYQSMTGNVLLGSSREPSKLYAGEGHYDVDSVYMLSNSNLEAGTWVDNTAGALSDTEPPFNLFQAVGASNCAYIGRQLGLVGCKMVVDTACSSAVSPGDLAFEYWNGSSWVEFNTAVYKSDAPYYSPSTSPLSAADSYHITFGLTSASPLAVKVINGKSAKWVRMRIVNALPSVPSIQMMKPHPNSTEIDSDGFIKHFGDSRSVRKIALEYADNYSAVAPSDQALYNSKSLYVNAVKNSFLPSVLNSVSFAVTLPRNVDISFPLKLALNYTGSSGAGNVFWRVRFASSAAGSSVYRNSTDAPAGAADESAVTLTTAVSGSDVVTASVVKFPIKVNVNAESGNVSTLWLTIERDATNPADTYAGNINVFDMSLWGVTWCDGVHVLGY